MDFPFHFSIGHTKILWHSIAEPLGMFIGFRYYLLLRKKQGDPISNNHRMLIFIGAIFGAIIGSRLVGGLENPPALFRAENKLIYFYQNKTVLGGFLFGVWGVELMKKIIGEKQSSGDLLTYPMILALIIGRLGCYSMGVYEETYGTATNFFSGINLGDGQLRHPVTLYEIAFLMLLWVALQQIEKHYQLARGGKFKLFMIAYLLFRFVLDFIKPHYSFGIGISTIQITAAGGLLYYTALWFRNKKFIFE